MSFCRKLKFSNPYIFADWLCKLWSKTIHSLKYQQSTGSAWKDIGINKSECHKVAKIFGLNWDLENSESLSSNI